MTTENERAAGVLCLYPTGCGGCGEPLPKRRRSWCSDACRDAWYVDHLWRWARLAAMKAANWRCLACGKGAREVDHIKERRGYPLHKPTCLHHQSNLRALCHDCHVNRRTVFGEAAPPVAAPLLQEALDFGSGVSQ